MWSLQFVILAVAIAPPPEIGDPIRNAAILKNLQGEWLVEGRESDGIQLIGEHNPWWVVLHFVVKGDKVIGKDSRGNEYDFKFKLKGKREADFVFPTKYQAKGIFALDGDILLLAISFGDQSIRPLKFNSGMGSNVTVYTLRRQKSH